MSDVTRLWRRSKMTEMSLIVSISSCLLYSENWWEAIFPIDDSLDVKSSDFDPRCVCRNLITSDSDSAKHECSSDYQQISIGLLSSTGSAVVPPTFCCQTSNTNTALWKVWKIWFVSKFSVRTWVEEIVRQTAPLSTTTTTDGVCWVLREISLNIPGWADCLCGGGCDRN